MKEEKKEQQKIEEKKEEPSVAPTSAEATAGKKAMEGEGFKKQLEECEKKAAEYLSGWQRERADFLNYKKEEMERIGQLINYAREELILEILPLMDNFEVIARQNFLSEKLSGQEKERVEKIIQGFMQIKIQFQDFLKSLGVEEIKSVGEKFDPKFHESVGEILPSEASAKEGAKPESGTIVEEIQKGYKSNGHLLRPARVKVSK